MFDFMGSMASIFNNVVVNNNNSGLNHFTSNNEIDLAKIKFVRSPNQDARTKTVKGIVLHHTGPFSNTESIVSWLTNPQAKASAHYVIGPAGDIVCLVQPNCDAWHAGVSDWTFGGTHYHDVNQVTIGIELCNFGLMSKNSDGQIVYSDGRQEKVYNGQTLEGSITFPDGRILKGYYAPYPDAQVEACVQLCKALIKKYPNITSKDIATHYQIAPQRKNDPFSLDVENVISRIFS